MRDGGRNIDQARLLRNDPTEAERRLWNILRARGLGGARFNRQVCVGPFICDFVARSRRLVIEVDGGQHEERRSQDAHRTRFLEARGYRVIRFWNHEIMQNLEGVAQRIEAELNALPRPLPQAGGGHPRS